MFCKFKYQIRLFSTRPWSYHSGKMKLLNTYFIVWTGCTCMFLIQFIIIWIDYSKGKTGLGNSQDHTALTKQLPCLTFCPLPSFKSRDFTAPSLETSMESYLDLTYNQEEIFSSEGNLHFIFTSKYIASTVLVLFGKIMQQMCISWEWDMNNLLRLDTKHCQGKFVLLT